MSADRWSDWNSQGCLGFEQRIHKEERALKREDDAILRGRATPSAAASSVRSHRSAASASTAAVSQRLERIEQQMRDEAAGREALRGQLDRLEHLVREHIDRQAALQQQQQKPPASAAAAASSNKKAAGAR